MGSGNHVREDGAVNRELSHLSGRRGLIPDSQREWTFHSLSRNP